MLDFMMYVLLILGSGMIIGATIFYVIDKVKEKINEFKKM